MKRYFPLYKVDALTNSNLKLPGRIAKSSDHNSILSDFCFQIKPECKERKVIHVFRDEASLKHFKEITTNTSKFSKCFKSDASLENEVEKWIKTLKSFINKAFKKIRI